MLIHSLENASKIYDINGVRERNKTIKQLRNSNDLLGLLKDHQYQAYIFITIPIVTLVLILGLLCFFPGGRCFLMRMSFVIDVIPCCEALITTNLVLAGRIGDMTIVALQAAWLVYLIHRVNGFKIVKDKFHLKSELIGSFLIWFVMEQLFFSTRIFMDINIFTECTHLLGLDTMRALFINALYIYLFIIRRGLDQTEIDEKINDFDQFLRNNICIVSFKEYADKNDNNSYLIIDFILDYRKYTAYCEHIKKKNLPKEKELMLISKYARRIRQVHFSIEASDKGSTDLNSNYSCKLSTKLKLPAHLEEITEAESMNNKENEEDTLLPELYDIYFPKILDFWIFYKQRNEEIAALKEALVSIDFYDMKNLDD